MFTIAVPAVNPKNRFRDQLPPPNKPIEFLAPPDEGTKIVIRILLAKRTLTEDDVRKRGTKLTFFHESIPMPRETVWLISFYEEYGWDEMQYIAKMIRTTKINLTPGSSKEDVTLSYMHILDGGTEPRIIDVPLGADNVSVETK